jgi:hypothetical protein
LTSEQMEASRAERMRQNGRGTLTLEDARTWIEETGLCLFLPRRQYSSSIAPSFVEAVIGQRNATPDPKHIAASEELLIRLETDGVVVRLNLLGQPGEQPDFVVASWVLPYVYALRGDRDWRRSPQLTGSRQVSPLAVQTYKLLEVGDATLTNLTHELGREVTEAAVFRAITELWQQLRIIPVILSPGQPAEWQLLRTRFQKAIAEGASTSQVTAISVLASIYLQAVIAASMEDVEFFLAPLTARSKVREVLRGLVATRQVHTITMGHAPHFYVAGTLPEFATAPTAYASASMPSSAYFMHSLDEEIPEPVAAKPAEPEVATPVVAPTSSNVAAIPADASMAPRNSAEPHTARSTTVRKPAASGGKLGARPHFSRPARRPGAESRPASSRTASNSRTASSAHKSSAARPSSGNGRPAARPSNGSSNNKASASRTAKPGAPVWGPRNGHSSGKPGGSSSAGPHNGNGSTRGPRQDSRPDARPTRNDNKSHKPALTASAKAGSNKRFGFTARPKQGTEKRG